MISVFTNDTNKREHTKKSSRNLIVIFLIAAILLLLILSAWTESRYNETFRPGWLLAANIIDLFFNENSVAFYLLFFLFITFFPLLFPRLCYKTEQFPGIVKKGIFSLFFLILLCLFNLFRKDFYTIDGKEINKLEAIRLLAMDCMEPETETIVVDDFEVDLHEVSYRTARSGSDHKVRLQYVTLPNGHNIPLASSLRNELSYLSWIKKSTKFTVYKNSKLLVAVDDVALYNLIGNVKRPSSQFEIALTPDGKISVVQSVVLKDRPDIAKQCQVCFARDGQLWAGFSIESVTHGSRGATWLPDDTYELYIMHGTSIISNIITYKKTGNTFQILE